MADHWLGISSAKLDSNCGDNGGSRTCANALDGLDKWDHDVDHPHWFIIDLGQTYTIKNLRGRSNSSDDPEDVAIFVSDDTENWGFPVAFTTGEQVWKNTNDWVELDTTEKDGRYIKVEVDRTEDANNNLTWGKSSPFMTIFDAYGDVVAPPAKGAMQTGKYWGEPI